MHCCGVGLLGAFDPPIIQLTDGGQVESGGGDRSASDESLARGTGDRVPVHRELRLQLRPPRYEAELTDRQRQPAPPIGTRRAAAQSELEDAPGQYVCE